MKDDEDSTREQMMKAQRKFAHSLQTPDILHTLSHLCGGARHNCNLKSSSSSSPAFITMALHCTIVFWKSGLKPPFTYPGRTAAQRGPPKRHSCTSVAYSGVTYTKNICNAHQITHVQR